MTITFEAISDWQKLDEKGDHLLRFLKAGDKVIGAALKHRIPDQDVWCEPGLLQWESYGSFRPLFTVTSEPNGVISLKPKVVCEICGDTGFIEQGQWVSMAGDLSSAGTSMKVLDVAEWDEAPDGSDDEVGFQIATRRDLGDKVPQEEEDADRKTYDLFSPAEPRKVSKKLTKKLGGNTAELKRTLEEEEELLAAEGIGRKQLHVEYKDSDGYVIPDSRMTLDEVRQMRAEQTGTKIGFEELIAEEQESLRKSLLDEALSLVTGDRNHSYGPPTADFTRTAGIWQALGFRGPNGRDMRPSDVSLLMIGLKLSRSVWMHKRDNFVDIAGYAACGWECAMEADDQE